MDFNKAFGAYDTIEGVNCLTSEKKQTQKEAALEAVSKIGLNQTREIESTWFKDSQRYTMFIQRLELLKQCEKCMK